jgi:hypothetical protein
MLAVSRTNLRWFIVGLVAVCVLGVLILPQVDLPDFVLNSAGSVIMCLEHVNNVAAFTSAGTVSILSGYSLLPQAFNILQPESILGHVNVSLELKKTSALRC